MILTPGVSDHGCDVVVLGWGAQRENVLIQCKATSHDELDSELAVRKSRARDLITKVPWAFYSISAACIRPPVVSASGHSTLHEYVGYPCMIAHGFRGNSVEVGFPWQICWPRMPAANAWSDNGIAAWQDRKMEGFCALQDHANGTLTGKRGSANWNIGR